MDPDGTAAGAGACIALFVLRVFFSCCEAALTEFPDNKVKSLEGAKGRKALLASLLSRPASIRRDFAAHRLVNTALIAVFFYRTFTVSLTLPDANGTVPLKGYAVAAALWLIVFILVFLVGDRLPKRIVKNSDPEKLAVVCAPAVAVLAVLLIPVTAVSDVLSWLVFRDSDAADPVTEEEILMLVDAGNETGSIESSEKEMINNVFEFHDMTVSEVMTHRTDITAVSEDADISRVIYTAINSGFSRIPVYKGSIDHISGIIYVKDLLCLIGSESAEGFSVRSFMRDAEFIPESCPCGELFHKLTARRLQLAVAVDEYGGTAGLVTMEDLVEAIVGNIQDEYDNETDDITPISANTFIVSGSADAADTMDFLGCPLPDDSGYDTMSGFVTDLLGRFPEDGETPEAVYRNITFTVLLTEDMRIIRIKAVKNEQKEKENNEQ